MEMAKPIWALPFLNYQLQMKEEPTCHINAEFRVQNAK